MSDLMSLQEATGGDFDTGTKAVVEPVYGPSLAFSRVQGIWLICNGVGLIECGLVALIQAGQFLNDPASGPSC
jgi:hypothetical protein